MNQDNVKESLAKIRSTDLPFTVTFSGCESKKVNGLYKPESQEILLHNKNFKNNNELMYTAIHEYTHHLMNEQIIIQTNGKKTLRGKAHTTEFWAMFHTLLTIAEELKVYSIGITNSKELSELTEDIKKNWVAKHSQFMCDFGKMLSKAHKLCIDAGVRYEDYIDRILRLPKGEAMKMEVISHAEITDESISYENTKILASISNQQRRAEAYNDFVQGKTSAEVKQSLKNKVNSKDNEDDFKTKLLRQEKKLTKTINSLTEELEEVQQQLEEL